MVAAVGYRRPWCLCGRIWPLPEGSINSMINGMTAKAKIAVTLPKELVEAARSAVQAGRAPSVSAYVARALDERAKLDDLDGLLAEMLTETGGAISDAERAKIDREAEWR